MRPKFVDLANQHQQSRNILLSSLLHQSTLQNTQHFFTLGHLYLVKKQYKKAFSYYEQYLTQSQTQQTSQQQLLQMLTLKFDPINEDVPIYYQQFILKNNKQTVLTSIWVLLLYFHKFQLSFVLEKLVTCQSSQMLSVMIKFTFSSNINNQAYEYAQRYAKQHQNYFPPLKALIEMSYKSKLYQDCIKYCQKIIEISKNEREYYMLMGRCHKELQNQDEALQAIEKYLQPFPTDQEANNLWEQIQKQIQDQHKQQINKIKNLKILIRQHLKMSQNPLIVNMKNKQYKYRHFPSQIPTQIKNIKTIVREIQEMSEVITNASNQILDQTQIYSKNSTDFFFVSNNQEQFKLFLKEFQNLRQVCQNLSTYDHKNLMQQLIEEVRFLNQLVSEHESEILELQSLVNEREQQIHQLKLTVQHLKTIQSVDQQFYNKEKMHYNQEMIPQLSNIDNIGNQQGELSSRSSVNKSRQFVYENNNNSYTMKEMDFVEDKNIMSDENDRLRMRVQQLEYKIAQMDEEINRMNDTVSYFGKNASQFEKQSSYYKGLYEQQRRERNINPESHRKTIEQELMDLKCKMIEEEEIKMHLQQKVKYLEEELAISCLSIKQFSQKIQQSSNMEKSQLQMEIYEINHKLQISLEKQEELEHQVYELTNNNQYLRRQLNLKQERLSQEIEHNNELNGQISQITQKQEQYMASSSAFNSDNVLDNVINLLRCKSKEIMGVDKIYAKSQVFFKWVSKYQQQSNTQHFKQYIAQLLAIFDLYHHCNAQMQSIASNHSSIYMREQTDQYQWYIKTITAKICEFQTLLKNSIEHLVVQLHQIQQQK